MSYISYFKAKPIAVDHLATSLPPYPVRSVVLDYQIPGAYRIFRREVAPADKEFGVLPGRVEKMLRDDGHDHTWNGNFSATGTALEWLGRAGHTRMQRMRDSSISSRRHLHHLVSIHTFSVNYRLASCFDFPFVVRPTHLILPSWTISLMTSIVFSTAILAVFHSFSFAAFRPASSPSNS